MFLRSHLASRLPVTALRLYCNSVPSTSSSPFYQSPASTVLSWRHNHTITPIHPQGFTPQLVRHFGASLAWIRGNRKDFEEAEEVKGARTKHTDDSNSSSSNKGGPEPIKPTKEERRAIMNEASSLMQRLMGTIALGCFMLYFLRTMKGTAVPDGLIPTDAPHVDFATFAEKFLRAGEIQKITFVIGHQKAVATLHAGAVIDGQPAKSNSVVINYPHRPPSQFREDVSREEAEMGISLAQGVRVEMLSIIPAWKWLVVYSATLALGVITIWNCKSFFKLKKAMK